MEEPHYLNLSIFPKWLRHHQIYPYTAGQWLSDITGCSARGTRDCRHAQQGSPSSSSPAHVFPSPTLILKLALPPLYHQEHACSSRFFSSVRCPS